MGDFRFSIEKVLQILWTSPNKKVQNNQNIGALPIGRVQLTNSLFVLFPVFPCVR